MPVPKKRNMEKWFICTKGQKGEELHKRQAEYCFTQIILEGL